jgi:integrase
VGSVDPYETAAGKRYRARYRDPDHRQRDKWGFKTKREAELFLATIEISKARGDFIRPEDVRMTVREIGAQWIANQTHMKLSAYRSVETAWRLHVLPQWGHRRLGEIRHSQVQSWVTVFGAGETKPRSATVVIRAYGVLAAILDTAVRDHFLASNPARGVRLPRKAKKKRAYLSPAQVELLAEQAGEYSTLVYTLAYTGIRWGEAIGLRVSSLDALRRRLLIQENAVTLGSKVVVGTPKTHENRSVPYPKFLSEPLAAACEGKVRDQLVFGDGVDYLHRAGSGKGWFWNAVQQSREIDKEFPGVTPHDLRHTAASIAISSGANPKAVQRMLGHASAAMTLDTYADLFEDDLDAVSERMDKVRSAAARQVKR